MSDRSTAADLERRWVSLPIAQSELGITERTVYRRVERGHLLSRRNASDRVEIVYWTPKTGHELERRYQDAAASAMTGGLARHCVSNSSGVR